MSMRTLNTLVGRSIMDPTLLHAFDASCVEDLICDMDFAPDLRARLCEIQAGSLQEFAAQSFAVVSEYEKGFMAIELPHPAEGLKPAQEVHALAA